MKSERNKIIVEDWQLIVNKPVYFSMEKILEWLEVHPEFLITFFGSIIQDRYLILKASVQSVKNGIIYKRRVRFCRAKL